MTPPAPSLGSAVAVIFRMQLRRLARSKKLRLGVVSCGLVVFAIVAARYASQREVGPDRAVELSSEAIRSGFQWGYFKLLVFLLPFLFTSSAIAEEVEGRTFAFLTTRPVSRVAITLGKFAAGAALAIGLVVGSGLVLHFVGYATEPTALFESFGQTLRILGALTLLVFAYCSVCIFWGAALPEAAGIVSALYLAVIEFLAAGLPGVFRCVSMNYLAQQIAGFPPGGLMPESAPAVPASIAAPVIAGIGLVFLLLAMVTVQTSEYRFGKA